jgi:flagellar secretion chaperone FliS
MAQNPYAKSARSYKAAAISTATPGQLILILFDGALTSMAIALSYFDEPDNGDRILKLHEKIMNAHDIILELQASLDLKQPGDFPRRMWNLYAYMMAQLREANLKKNPEQIKVVEGLLRKIRDAWAEMLDSTSTTQAA